MDHLAVADVDTAVVIVAADVARLGVRDARVAHEAGGGAQAAVAAEQAVAHQAGAVVGIRPHGAPGIGLAQLAVGAIDGRAANGSGASELFDEPPPELPEPPPELPRNFPPEPDPPPEFPPELLCS